MDLYIRTYFDEEIRNFWEKQEKIQNLNLFQSYIWNSKVLEHFYDDRKNQIQIFVFKEKNEVIAILPFYKKKQLGFNILSLIGEGFTDYNSILLRKDIMNEEKKINELIYKLKSYKNDFDIIYFKNQLNNIDLYPINPFFKFFNFKKDKKNYGIKIFGLWKDYIKENNLIKFEKQINYGLRKLEIDIKKNFLIITDNFKKKEIILQTLKNKKKFSSLYTFEKLKNFFLDNEILKRVHCSGIYNKTNELLASNIGILEKNKFIYYYPSYTLAKDKNKYSPGSILLYCLINFSFNNGIKFFDFGVGNENYKKRWSNIIFNTYEYIYTHNLKGKIFKIIKNFY